MYVYKKLVNTKQNSVLIPHYSAKSKKMPVKPLPDEITDYILNYLNLLDCISLSMANVLPGVDRLLRRRKWVWTFVSLTSDLTAGYFTGPLN